MRHRWLSLALIATPASFVAAQASKTFSFDLLPRIVGVSGVELSPDGRTAVITVTRSNFDDNRRDSELYAVDVASGAMHPLTYERRSVGGAKFSPDGSTLAYMAPDTSGRMQVYALSMSGGEARHVTAQPNGVEHFAWRPDGRAIAFASSDSGAEKKGQAKHLTKRTLGDQDLFLHDEITPQHIWVTDVDSSDARRVTRGPWSLEFELPPGSAPSGLSWSADGRTIAFAQVVAPESGKLDSVRVALVDVATGTVRALTNARTFENNPVFSPDGKSVAYWYPREGRGDLGWENEVWVAPASGGSGRSITHALDRNLFGAQWMSDGKSLLVAGNDKAGVGLWIASTDGSAPRRVDTGDLVVNGAFGYDVSVASHAPTIAFTATTPDHPSELYVMDSPTANPRRLTNFNAWASDIAWGKRQAITWKSDAFEADGIVTLPPSFNPAHKYPLVLVIHGGPQSSSKVSFSSLAQIMAANGWVVFEPNYRGSDNLGNAYQAAIVNDAGAGPGRDVMAGVALLKQRPYIDTTRVAVTGWSYGGFMTTWLIGNYPNAWKAAVAGAPVTNWEDMYNFSDGNVEGRYLFGGSPWTGDYQKAYREQSPITYARKVRTPTLLITKMEDFRVPPTQAFEFYHALQDNGVETKLVGFNGRGHFSSDPVNSREELRTWVEWVQAHLGAVP
jgi:dipeptidyl aminopeptidase/acylaminoacyl peptidase